MDQPAFRRCLSVVLLLALGGAWAAAPLPARAAPAGTTFTVNTTSDQPDVLPGNGSCEVVSLGSGFCTLRAAIQEANAWPGDDTINFSAAIPTPATFTLTRAGTDDTSLDGDLDIASNLTLTGRGATNTIIDGNQLVTNDRVLQIVSGTVTLSGLTIRNGNHNSGGGLANTGGILTVVNSTLSQNGAVFGGAVYNVTTATLSGVTLSNNFAEHGGAIYNVDGGTVTLNQGSLATDNEGYYEAGAIYNAGTLAVTGATLSGNNHSYGCCGLAHFGGGIYNSATGKATLSNSTVSDNDSHDGGGLYNAGQATLTNVALADNYAAFGGGAVQNTATLTLTNSSLTENLAGFGGGVYSSGTLMVDHSAVNDNTADAYGGGFYNTGTLFLYPGSAASGNSAYYDGGGLHNTGTATLTGATLANNFAGTSSGLGGGIYNNANVTLAQATVMDNGAAYGGGLYNAGLVTWTDGRLTHNTASLAGGGLYIDGAGIAGLINVRVNDNGAGNGGGVENVGSLTVTGVTVDGNTASQDGGGILNNGSWLGRNSTVVNNQAGHAGGGVNNAGTTNLFNDTIAYNRAALSDDEGGSTFGSGIFVQGGEFNFRNGLMAGNHITNSSVLDDCSGSLTTVGAFRISTTVSCTLSGPWAIVSPASVGPLGYNGGPTPTVSLLPGSSAIDAGDPVQGCVDWQGTMTTDQRGGARVVGARCDVGAYEFGNTLPILWISLVLR